jgi:PadR family transcriptional regulator, regulatory protein PadR
LEELDAYEITLLQGWEDVYKKSLLSLWILLALQKDAKHMAEIKEYISNATNETILADDKSMYRALRRFGEAQLVTFEMVKSMRGPDLKIYSLTKTGQRLLRTFVKRNITNIYFNKKNRDLFNQ